MDTSFHYPKCALHITADDSVVGEEIDCPECGTKFRVPPPAKPKLVPVVKPAPAPVASHAKPHDEATPASPSPAKPESKSASHAAEHKPLVLPQHHGPAEPLVKKAAPAEHKDEPPRIRVKTIKHGSCVDMGHDLFDEKVMEFLNKIGQENIIQLSPVSYGAMDSTGHMLPDYGVLIIYKG